MVLWVDEQRREKHYFCARKKKKNNNKTENVLVHYTKLNLSWLPTLFSVGE